MDPLPPLSRVGSRACISLVLFRVRKVTHRPRPVTSMHCCPVSENYGPCRFEDVPTEQGGQRVVCRCGVMLSLLMLLSAMYNMSAVSAVLGLK